MIESDSERARRRIRQRAGMLVKLARLDAAGPVPTPALLAEVAGLLRAIADLEAARGRPEPPSLGIHEGD